MLVFLKLNIDVLLCFLGIHHTLALNILVLKTYRNLVCWGEPALYMHMKVIVWRRENCDVLDTVHAIYNMNRTLA